MTGMCCYCYNRLCPSIRQIYYRDRGNQKTIDGSVRSGTVDLGPNTFSLGLAIKRDDSTGKIKLSHETYARGISDIFCTEDANSLKTPTYVKTNK